MNGGKCLVMNFGHVNHSVLNVLSCFQPTVVYVKCKLVMITLGERMGSLGSVGNSNNFVTMRPQKNQILGLSFLISFLCTLDGFSQTAYDHRLVSNEIELNFELTDKRGIRADNGVIYIVENAGQILTAYYNNKVKWTADILKSCPKPEVGKPEIRYIKLTADKIEITFGKHDFANVDIVNGEVKCLGTD